MGFTSLNPSHPDLRARGPRCRASCGHPRCGLSGKRVLAAAEGSLAPPVPVRFAHRRLYDTAEARRRHRRENATPAIPNASRPRVPGSGAGVGTGFSGRVPDKPVTSTPSTA